MAERCSGVFTDSGQALGNQRTLGLSLGDVDGDGDLDLLLATSSGTRLRLNAGSGDFSAGVQSLGTQSSYDVQLADVDGDGDLDLVEGNYNQPNRILLNDGSGNFSNSGQTLGSDLTYAVAVGDLNGDGDLDFIEGNYGQTNRVWFNINTVDLSLSSNTGSEAAQTSITVTATATATVDADKTLDLSVSGSGISTEDYSLSTTQITIPGGGNTGSVTFTVLDDNVFEGTETASLTLANPSTGIYLGSVISQDLVITDDETAPVVTGIAFDVADFSENGAMTVLTLTQSNPAAGETCFDVSFTGTALAGTDFASEDDDPATAGTQVCIASGETAGTITLTGLENNVFEGDKTITATAADRSASVTISDDETAPTITGIAFDVVDFLENGGTALLTVTLSGPSSSTICFNVTFTGTAQLDNDYSSEDNDNVTAGTQVCIGAGNMVGTLTLTGLDDILVEDEETVTASTGTDSATTVIISNDQPGVIFTDGFESE
jgi:hypothetical protein